MKYFIDTSFWCALYNSNDENYQNAKKLWDIFTTLPVQFFTSEYVFDETITLVKRRMNHRSAVELGEGILQSEVVHLWRVTEYIFEESWRLFERHTDKDFSFTDCTSFALMQFYGLNQALAFDRHFPQMGFLVNQTSEK